MSIQHAVLGASSSKRWLTCPGSVRESVGRPDRATVYAMEGTAAHDVAAQCLSQQRDAIEFLDRYIDVVEEKDGEPPLIHRFLCDEEMVGGVQLYLDLCRETNDCGLNPDNIVFVEQRVSWNALDPSFPDPLFGTSDFGVYKRRDKRLVVIDFKFGAGVVVEATGNTQTRCYGLGLLLDELLQNEQVETVELVICQPRGQGEPIRREVLTVDELLDWGQSVLMPGAWATKKPDAPIVVGDAKHCQFCPAAAECQELREHALRGAMVMFDPLDAMPITGVELTAPHRLTPQQIAQLLGFTDTFMLWLRAVREHAFGLINAGVEIPDWKLVGRKGNRRYVDAPTETAVALLFMLGLPYDELWAPPKLKSPNQIEQTIKRLYGSNAKLINSHFNQSGLFETPTTGTTLARRDDKRQEVIGADITGFERLDPP